jgi:hypothetical protein
MNTPVQLLLGEAAIGTGDDVLAAHYAGESEDALGDQIRMLYDVGSVAHDTGREYFAIG